MTSENTIAAVGPSSKGMRQPRQIKARGRAFDSKKDWPRSPRARAHMNSELLPEADVETEAAMDLCDVCGTRARLHQERRRIARHPHEEEYRER